MFASVPAESVKGLVRHHRRNTLFDRFVADDLDSS